MRKVVYHQYTTLYNSGTTWKKIRAMSDSTLIFLYNKIMKHVQPTSTTMRRITDSVDAPTAKRPKRVEIVTSFDEAREPLDTPGVSSEVPSRNVQFADTSIETSIATKEASKTLPSRDAESTPVVVIVDSPEATPMDSTEQASGLDTIEPEAIPPENVQSTKPIIEPSIATEEPFETLLSTDAGSTPVVVIEDSPEATPMDSTEQVDDPSSITPDTTIAEPEGVVADITEDLVKKASHEAMVQKVSQQAPIDKAAREKLDAMHAKGGSIPISPHPTSDIPAEDIYVESEKVPPSSSFTMGMYIPGRRGKRMAHSRHVGIRRSVRLSKKKSTKDHVTDKKKSSKHVDLQADNLTFIKKGSPVNFPEGQVDILTYWRVTDDGQFNIIARMDKVTLQFTLLKEILHLVDKQDLITLYNMVKEYYTTHTPKGVGLYLLGDLRVLFESQPPDTIGYSIWKNNHKWKIDRWRFYSLPYVHMVETKNGIRVYMFSDTEYPLSHKLMRRMLRKKLEVSPEPIGNDMTYVEQLVGLIKSKLQQSTSPT